MCIIYNMLNKSNIQIMWISVKFIILENLKVHTFIKLMNINKIYE